MERQILLSSFLEQGQKLNLDKEELSRAEVSKQKTIATC